MKYKHFAYNSSDPLNGVINYLREYEPDKFNNFLTVQVDSSGSSVGKPRYTIDKTELYWNDNRNDQSPITYLMPYPIKTDGYLIQTSNNDPGVCHPKSWKFEASLDGVNNKISKEYSDGGKLNNRLASAYFEIKKDIYQTFKIIPLTSYRYDCVKRFDLNEFEIYGTILFPNESTCSNNKIETLVALIYLIICL